MLNLVGQDNGHNDTVNGRGFAENDTTGVIERMGVRGERDKCEKQDMERNRGVSNGRLSKDIFSSVV